MTLKKKLYRMFILGTDGGGYIDALQNGLGGMIFFSHDIKSPNQIKNFINELKLLSCLKHPFFSIDQEGGRVERTENIHNGKKYLSARYACAKGMDFLTKQTEMIAKELNEYGINLNFAPCIDVNTNPLNPIIGERAFSDKQDVVCECGKLVSKVYFKNNIMPCLKHFPGHGDAGVDSHLMLPKIDLNLDEMEHIHIKPFRNCIENAKMVMVGHLYCSCFDKHEVPCSLSKNAIGYLRNRLNFKGIIISDDMIMKGVAKYGPVEACIMGIKAGLNMFIYRNSKFGTVSIIEDVLKIAEKDDFLRAKIEESYEIITRVSDEFFS